MNKKILGTVLLGALVLTGCGSSKGGADVTGDLTKAYNGCLDQNESYICMMNYTLQNYLETYTNYRLLNTSEKEFTIKPEEANSLFTYGASRDSMCNYKYALFYNKDNDSYYSVKLECNGNDDNPKFAEAALLK